MLNTILTSIENAIANGATPYIKCRVWSPFYQIWFPADLVACDLDRTERCTRYFRRRGMKDLHFVVTVGIKGNRVTVYTNEGAI